MILWVRNLHRDEKGDSSTSTWRYSTSRWADLEGSGWLHLDSGALVGLAGDWRLETGFWWDCCLEHLHVASLDGDLRVVRPVVWWLAQVDLYALAWKVTEYLSVSAYIQEAGIHTPSPVGGISKNLHPVFKKPQCSTYRSDPKRLCLTQQPQSLLHPSPPLCIECNFVNLGSHNLPSVLLRQYSELIWS